MTHDTQLKDFVQQIARMNYDGEETEDGEFIMQNDDAVDTLNGLIHEARALLGIEEEEN